MSTTPADILQTILAKKEEEMIDRLLEFKKKNKVESRRTKKNKK